MIRMAIALMLLALAFLLASWLLWGAGNQPVVAAVAPSPSPAQYGRELFMARGCTSCHRHNGLVSVNGPGRLLMGPDLTRYRPDPDFVRAWLADPATIRPGTPMPNLNLSSDQIEALLAFLQENATE